jgi:hypothetical protein
MAKYKAVGKGQGLFLTVDLEKQLIPGTFEWTMSRIVDNEIYLKQFDSYYRNDTTGHGVVHQRRYIKSILKERHFSKKTCHSLLLFSHISINSYYETVIP